MTREQKKKTTTTEKEKGKEQKPAEANPETIAAGQKAIEDADKLIDKIDDILEENSEEFVKNYVQKGGE